MQIIERTSTQEQTTIAIMNLVTDKRFKPLSQVVGDTMRSPPNRVHASDKVEASLTRLMIRNNVKNQTATEESLLHRIAWYINGMTIIQTHFVATDTTKRRRPVTTPRPAAEPEEAQPTEQQVNQAIRAVPQSKGDDTTQRRGVNPPRNRAINQSPEARAAAIVARQADVSHPPPW